MTRGREQTLEEGFNNFVIKNPSGCWAWKGCKANPGYGQFGYSGNRVRAHRASWIIHFGEIPKGLFVLHKCDNRECSNPDHLFLGTNLDNIKDMMDKKRHPTMGAQGDKNPMTKLKENEVKEIRQLIGTGLTQREIAKTYKISPGAVTLIKNNTNWRYL